MFSKHIILYTTLFICTTVFADYIEIQSINVNAKVDTEIQDTITKQSSSLAKEAKGETLGDFLQNEPFVDSASYGPAVGRPVVRGMDGYRVGINNGNVNLNDLSAMSQDHAVGVMPRASQKIELIKGPASLLYGNYSGGIIRIMGEEHEKSLLKEGYSLNAVASYGTNGAGKVLGSTLTLSDNNISLSVNTFHHKAENYTDANHHEVKDSDTLTVESHLVLGCQYNTDNIVKIYLDTMKKNYGIPNETLKSTTIEISQERYGLVWHADEPLDGIKYMQSEIQVSNYLHSELEAQRADGLFSQKQFSLSSMFKFDIDDWSFKANAEYQNSELKVCHEHGKCTKFFDAQRTNIQDGVALQQNIDRFSLRYAHGHPMPNISESSLKAGLLGSYFLNDNNELKIALRGEKRRLTPNSNNIQEVWLVSPDIDLNYYNTMNNYALSSSLGFASDINRVFSLESSLAYVQRLPSSTELFWNGFHHATDTYIFGDKNLKNEESLNIDIDTMIIMNEYTTKMSLFYYYFFNYIYQTPLADSNANLLKDPFHQSNVWAVKGVGASVYGVAIKESYQKEFSGHQLNASIEFQAIRGRLHKGGNLPRIPTLSATLKLEHAYRSYKANIAYKYVDKSRFTADNETGTPSYNWISAFVSYEKKMRYLAYSIYLKGENLSNEIAYNHLSFLKQSAPLPGRQITLGVELNF